MSARFRDIDNAFPFIARQVLVARLSELREIGLIARTVEDGPPLSTSYCLTEDGEKLAVAASILHEVALLQGKHESKHSGEKPDS